MTDAQVIHLRFETRTPVHIGTGQQLLRNYDYTVHKRQTYRLDVERILSEKLKEDPTQFAWLSNQPPASLLQGDSDFTRADFFQYQLPGEPQTQKDYSELRECIKDIHAQPFLPGSSIKGALRTALMWQAWANQNKQWTLKDFGENRKFASNRVSNTLLGRNPNDALRAVRVTDARLTPSAQTAQNSALQLINVRVASLDKPIVEGIPVPLEVIAARQSLACKWVIDWPVVEGWGRRQNTQMRNAAGSVLQSWLTSLRAYALDLLEHERQWATQHGKSQMTVLCQRLHAEVAGNKNSFAIQVGWGGGYTSKTLGTQLFVQPDDMLDLIQKYRLRNAKIPDETVFPATRRLWANTGEPLGWIFCKVDAE